MCHNLLGARDCHQPSAAGGTHTYALLLLMVHAHRGVLSCTSQAAGETAVSARKIAAPAAAIRSAFRFDEAVLTTGLNVPWEMTSGLGILQSQRDSKLGILFF